MTTAQLTLHQRSLAPLRDLCAQLLADPGRSRLAIAVMDVTPAWSDTADPDRVVARAGIRHVAAITDPADRRVGRYLLRRQYERLADRPVLPWRLEEDLSSILDNVPVQE